MNATFSPRVMQAPFSVFVGRLSSKIQPFHENVGICIHKNVSLQDHFMWVLIQGVDSLKN